MLGLVIFQPGQRNEGTVESQTGTESWATQTQMVILFLFLLEEKKKIVFTF